MEPIQSSSCGNGVASLGKASSPLKVTEDISFRCCSCSYVTRDQREIVIHLVAHGDEQFKSQHPPVSSGSWFKVPSNTQNNKSDKFQCRLCPQAFAQNSNHRRHNQTHTSEKPFKCKLCPHAFARNSALRMHNRTHTGEKPFKCKLCPKAFARNSDVKIHNRTHTGEKPFKCKLCPKAFALNSDLRRHNRTHTGEKPFKCKLCLKVFARNFGLRMHNQTHTESITKHTLVKSHLSASFASKPLLGIQI
ncbi:zinc finger protein 700-like isoform X2 [Ixodes scapularis]|uniref:zinc finger protein 700-like isoform X2 n=1 Tax=Ixodes scapularis TaxID=6945 RepID=UPI001C3946AA|nr:zinc finger protein 700-like isoform X2 [Ixodes scapularis]